MATVNKIKAVGFADHVDMTIPPLGIVVLKNIPMPPRKKKI